MSTPHTKEFQERKKKHLMKHFTALLYQALVLQTITNQIHTTTKKLTVNYPD